jgi:hypothetical protein
MAGNLLAAAKCAALKTWLEIRCGTQIALLIALPVKALKVAETVSGAYDLSKVGKRWRPLFRVFNKIKRYKIKRHAPSGLRTGGEIARSITQLYTAWKVVRFLPKLNRALSKADYAEAGAEIADVLGIDACVDAVKLGLDYP